LVSSEFVNTELFRRRRLMQAQAVQLYRCNWTLLRYAPNKLTGGEFMRA
jgi:hypothetical protein